MNDPAFDRAMAAVMDRIFDPYSDVEVLPESRYGPGATAGKSGAAAAQNALASMGYVRSAQRQSAEGYVELYFLDTGEEIPHWVRLCWNPNGAFYPAKDLTPAPVSTFGSS